MSLLTPSIGEIVDRLTIIALKQESGNAAPHLEQEAQALTKLLGEKVKVHPEVLSTVQKYSQERYYDRLAAVNAFIWHKEDEVRRLGVLGRVYNPQLVADLAVAIRTLADRRHHLIAEIDALFGDPRAGKEKSWMKPTLKETVETVKREVGEILRNPRPAEPSEKEKGPASYNMRCPSCGDQVRYIDEETVQCQRSSCRWKTDAYEAMKAYDAEIAREAERRSREAAFPTHTGLPAYCPRCGTTPCREAARNVSAPFDKYKLLVPSSYADFYTCPHCNCMVKIP